MGFVVVIPARYASTRLPGKPLRPIAGRPMIEHVWRRASESAADEVIIATDDARIADAAQGFGARVCLTDPAHPSGTDRLAEVAQRLGLDDGRILVNLQGDEPLMPAALIDQVAGNLAARPDAAIATLCAPITDADELFDPNSVKVVVDAGGYALYFSRAVVPWSREQFAGKRRVLATGYRHLRHLGLYAYRAGYLQRYVARGACGLEKLEALEQLRALWHGDRVHVDIAIEAPGVEVDNERDIARVERILAQRGETG
jgi:3-deoxy-manno-octulosonate cytidylyltransferase (CMP-KDO synthetase)